MGSQQGGGVVGEVAGPPEEAIVRGQGGGGLVEDQELGRCGWGSGDNRSTHFPRALGTHEGAGGRDPLSLPAAPRAARRGSPGGVPVRALARVGQVGGEPLGPQQQLPLRHPE
jgi:hypothetical protein